MVPLRHGALAVLFLLLATAPALAADPWLAANVRGTVLMQTGSQWTEIESGDSIASGVPVRTLQAGRVELRRHGEALQLGPNTVIRPSDPGTVVTIEQYAGQLTLIETRERKYQLVTPSFTATTGGASVVSSIAGGQATLLVQRGRVPVKMKGRAYVLVAGQVVSSGAGGAVTVTGPGGATSGMPSTPGGVAPPPAAPAVPPSTPATPVTPPKGPALGGTPGSGGTADNGVGNGGIPGNGGQNGNAGGNGGAGIGNGPK